MKEEIKTFCISKNIKKNFIYSPKKEITMDGLAEYEDSFENFPYSPHDYFPEVEEMEKYHVRENPADFISFLTWIWVRTEYQENNPDYAASMNYIKSVMNNYYHIMDAA